MSISRSENGSRWRYNATIECTTVRDLYKLKVLIVSNMYPSERFPSYGTFVKNIADALGRSGLVVERCVVEKQSSGIGKLLAYFRFFCVTFFRYHFRSYDVVYVHYLSHSFVPLLFSAVHRKNRILAHAHGGDVLRQSGVSALYFRLKSWVTGRALARADGVVVPSSYYRALLIDRFMVEPERIHVVASGGVDRDVFYPSHTCVDEGFVIGYVGRLDPGKGLETMVRALETVAASGSVFKCLVIGDGELREGLSSLVISLGIQGRVTFLGAMPQGDLRELITTFDVLVFPTERESESLGLVGLEAMACGVPVIGSRIGGLQDYLVDAYNGFFFHPKDAAELARKIIAFQGLDEQGRRRLSQAAIETARRYDAVTENSKLLQIVSELSSGA